MPRTYAVGDIHGSLSKLRSLMARCERDAGGQSTTFVFVGDYLDRGPDSRGVVAFLLDLQARLGGGNAICLMGNHEALALAAIESSTQAGNWLLNGGDTTLRSYGVSSAQDLPADHVAWLQALRLSHDDGQRLFVHAGIHPSRPLDAQDARDLLWIREPFLSDSRDHGRFIVHGHTPCRTGMPDLRTNRVNIDTAVAYGGPLTAAVFTDDQSGPVDFIQVSD